MMRAARCAPFSIRLWYSTSVVVAACSPYFVSAALRLLLHMLKKPVPPPDGSSARPMRPG